MPRAGQANRLELDHPVLKSSQLQAIQAMSLRGWETKARKDTRSARFSCALSMLLVSAHGCSGLRCPGTDPAYRGLQVIDTTWPVAEGPQGLVLALDRIAEETAQAIDDGFDFVVLSDRAAGGLGGRGPPRESAVQQGAVRTQASRAPPMRYPLRAAAVGVPAS